MKALSHAQVRLLIEKAADGLLTASEQRALESHLHGCAECRAYAAGFAALEAALGAALLERCGQPNLGKASEARLVNALQKQFSPGPGGNIDGAQGSPPTHSDIDAEWRLPTLPVLLGIVLVGLILLGIFWFISAIGNLSLIPTSTATETPTPTFTLTAPSSPTNSTTPTSTSTSTPTILILIAIPQQNVNCREGNSSMFDIADTLYEDEEYTPIARGFDNLWVQFRGPVTNVKCWVFVDNIDLLVNDQITPIKEIPESLLPFATYPPTPTPTFTPSPELLEPSDTPVVSTQPQCNDGVDNDQDGAIDGRDKDCKDAKDNNEFD